MSIKKSSASNFYLPYNKYEIKYGGDIVSNGYSTIAINIIKNVIPITFANGKPDTITLDATYNIQCEMFRVSPKSIALLFNNAGISSPDNDNKDVMKFSASMGQGTIRRQEQTGNYLEIKAKSFPKQNNLFSETMFFYNTIPVCTSINGMGYRSRLSFSVDFVSVTRFKRSVLGSSNKDRWIIGGLGNPADVDGVSLDSELNSVWAPYPSRVRRDVEGDDIYDVDDIDIDNIDIDNIDILNDKDKQ